LKQNASTLEEAVARFKSAVEKGALQWRGSEQHDAQEFFLWLLDRLHEDLNQASSNKYKPIKVKKLYRYLFFMALSCLERNEMYLCDLICTNSE